MNVYKWITNEYQINQIMSSLSLTGGGTRIKLVCIAQKKTECLAIRISWLSNGKNSIYCFGWSLSPISPADHFYFFQLFFSSLFYGSACSLSRTVKLIVVISQWVYDFSLFGVCETIDIKIHPMRARQVFNSTNQRQQQKMNIQSYW